MDKLHLIMPMGGRGSRFFKDGFAIPKPLIMLNGKPFLYWAVQSVVKFIEVKDITFVVLQEHIDLFHIDLEIYKYYPNAKIVVIASVLDGAVLTCMEGIKEIENGAPILFNDCDHMFVSKSFNQFCQNKIFNKIDGALLTFESRDPKYSYIKFNKAGQVICTAEKEVVSNHAICGAYYFKNKKIFIDAAEQYLTECSYKEFYVSGIYNIMSREGKLITGFEADIHIPFGIPKEYYLAELDLRLKEVE